ncbi:MAG: Do family serine endopeptidase [Hyphomonadaceae bacterium]
MTDQQPHKPHLSFGAVRGPRLWLALGAAAALVAAGGVGGAVGAALMQGRAGAAPPISLPGAAGGPPFSFAEVAQRVKPAVVSVHVQLHRPRSPLQAIDPDGPLGEFFRRFGDQRPSPQLVEAAGSGFFISEDGYIVTNNHVVENADRLSITTDDGRDIDARLIGRDPRTDLAVIKVDGGHFPYVRFAEHEPRIGDWVLAVGNPFGLGGTVTSGIVSARGRDIGAGPYDDFLQIDAPVNQGNSGGPAFNLNGEVVGVNTAIYSPSGGNVGIAFAIPAATARPIVEALRRNGSITRGYLGVSAQPLNQDLARSMGVDRANGALIAEVTPASPAERAGLRPGDIIVSINDQDVADARALARVVGNVRPGADTRIGYIRDGRTHSTHVALAQQPGQKAESVEPDRGGGKPGPAGADQNAALGLAVAPARVAGVAPDGLAVVGVDPNGAAAQRGIGVGDVILEAGGRAVSQPGDLDTAVADARRSGRNVLLLRVQSENGAGYVAVPIGAG